MGAFVTLYPFFRYIRSERSIILLNFCLSIICSNILILVGQTQTHNAVSVTQVFNRHRLESVKVQLRIMVHWEDLGDTSQRQFSDLPQLRTLSLKISHLWVFTVM